MIFDQLSHAGRYLDLHPRFRAAFDALCSFDPATSDGQINLDGDHLFLNVERYRTEPADLRRYESHRVYLDIQTIFAGTETIYVESLDRLRVIEPYDTDRDAAFYDGPQGSRLDLTPGDFAILYPEDGHMPVCATDHQPADVLKVVAKVRIK